MNRDQALALADELAARNETPKHYAVRLGLKYNSLLSQASRAGVLLGVEIRLRRVRAVEQAKTTNPNRTYGRLALDAGWSSHPAFTRARKALRERWGRA